MEKRGEGLWRCERETPGVRMKDRGVYIHLSHDYVSFGLTSLDGEPSVGLFLGFFILGYIESAFDGPDRLSSGLRSWLHLMPCGRLFFPFLVVVPSPAQGLLYFPLLTIWLNLLVDLDQHHNTHIPAGTRQV